MARILIVDDEERIRHLLSLMLQSGGYAVDQAGDGLAALERLKDAEYDMVISDIKMPRMDGHALLSAMRAQEMICPVVFITAFATVESAVEMMRNGAADYITKPFEEDRVLLTVTRTLNLSKLLTENREMRSALAKRRPLSRVVYASKQMAGVMSLADKVAPTDSAVLITGESGTGKEVLAAYIHENSRRSGGRFVPVNCAAISPSLVESELFGYEKGAFTGAEKRTLGKFEFAAGGTLFLDEIGDLPLEAQAKLLRALQEKKIQRVGGHEEMPVDVRVICATNHDLEQQVRENAFRQDLFFRINVFPIQPAPLRDRKDDIEILAGYFLERLSGNRSMGISRRGLEMLQAYDWPGNVRELANVIERAFILDADAGEISAGTLSFLSPANPVCEAADGRFRLPAEGISLEGLQKDLVRQAMTLAGNNQASAARLLGVTRAKFRVLLKGAFES
ncbi:MAG: histidine kinase [Deltaproteobacteria bacterium]|nr:MAG: histidine kinase [Deltaproteobacteria bacterium]